jgi:transposase
MFFDRIRSGTVMFAASVMEDTAMAKPLLSDELWKRIEPLLPPLPPHPRGGRPWIGNREALVGILFVLRTGIPWELLPHEMGCGCGMTCWRRLRDWQAAGVWRQLHELLLAELNGANQIDWSRAVVDSALLRAMCGGPKTGPNPTDRRKPGSKHHVLTDAHGTPLVVILTAANVHDVRELLPLVDRVPSVRGKPGHPRHRFECIQADTAYDSEPHRKALRKRGITPVIPKRNRKHGSGLGVFRWVVERTISWLHQFRRLRIRWERRDDIHEAFVSLSEALICLNQAKLVLC